MLRPKNPKKDYIRAYQNSFESSSTAPAKMDIDDELIIELEDGHSKINETKKLEKTLDSFVYNDFGDLFDDDDF